MEQTEAITNPPKLLRPSPCDLTKPCLLFFDLDGTLLRSGRLPEENRTALLRAKERGIAVHQFRQEQSPYAPGGA